MLFANKTNKGSSIHKSKTPQKSIATISNINTPKLSKK